MQEDADIQLVMDTGSDAATGEGSLRSEEYEDPNSTYPHASSLRRPKGIVREKDQPEYDFPDNNDLAVQYVQGIHIVLYYANLTKMTIFILRNYLCMVTNS